MIAVVKLGGNQFTVKVGDVIEVDNQNQEAGSMFDSEALLVASEDGKDVKVGTPFVSGSKVEFKVLENFKDEKVRVFKMKPKKRYARTFGFRAHMTKLEVVSIA